MGFTLGVQNAPSPATQWMATCNYYSTGEPGMTAPLLLAQKWNCLDPAPGENWLGIACFDAEGNIVQEAAGEVTIEDGRDYVFDFATNTLGAAAPSIWGMAGPLLVLGLMAAMVGMMAPALKKGFS